MDVATNSAYNTPYANTTILSALLLSLAKQQNAPKTATTFKSEYDYVIVGAGAAGSVVASRLSEVPCVSVLLLEAGKSPPLITDIPVLSRNFWGSDLDWNYKTVPQKNTGSALVGGQVLWPSGKGIGGSTIFSASVFSRANRKNFDDWAKDGAVGWSASDTRPYFLKFEDNHDDDFLADGYHVVGGPQPIEKPKYKSDIKEAIFEAAKELGDEVVDPNGRKQTGFYDQQEYLNNGQRSSVAKSYLVPAENRPNLDILQNAFVKKVKFSRKRAVGVEFDFGGKKRTVKATREVIMSAGTINTAQLLLLSGVGPKKDLKTLKIKVVADLPVGNNFQDHCGILLPFSLGSSPGLLQKITDPSLIDEYINNRTGPLTASEGISATAFLNVKPNPEVDYPDYELYFAELPAQVLQVTLGLKPEIFEQLYGAYMNASMYICLAQQLHPKSRGTIKLSSKDPYDAPLIDPNYLDDPSDILPIVEGMKKCKAIGTSEHLKKVGSELLPTLQPGCEKYDGNDDDYFKCVLKTYVGSLTHQAGTARMGDPNDPRTVVDAQLRVKGIEGLRVVDASVMPTIVSGNSIGATLMVAEKASDMIKYTLNCNTQIAV